MKKLLHTLSILLLTVFAAHSQVVLLDADGEDITNQTITVTGTTDESYIRANIFFSNSGDEDVEVWVRKHEVDLAPSHANTFCWVGFCFTPLVFEVDSPVVLASGESSTSDDFYTELYPEGASGTSQVMYEFYDDRDSFETVTVSIIYEVETPTSADYLSNTNQWRLEDARPNPARSHTWINYQVPADARNASIVVRNLLGNPVINEDLSASENKLRLDTSRLSNGIYIYSLLIDNQVVQSKRLVVAN
ncbi:MAG: T9SS type A sorting domain-containing protein [Bacteroidota bacterium]